MRNPYKKFQNSSIHSSKVMLCIKKRDGQTDNLEAICPSNFFEVGGIKMFIVCLCWGFTAQSTQWGHVERSQFT